MSKYSAPEHHHLHFCRSGDHNFRNVFTPGRLNQPSFPSSLRSPALSHSSHSSSLLQSRAPHFQARATRARSGAPALCCGAPGLYIGRPECQPDASYIQSVPEPDPHFHDRASRARSRVPHFHARARSGAPHFSLCPGTLPIYQNLGPSI